ncbi:MAG: transglutaminase domain-containing protein, partial [Bacteroidota bacterium]
MKAFTVFICLFLMIFIFSSLSKDEPSKGITIHNFNNTNYEVIGNATPYYPVKEVTKKENQPDKILRNEQWIFSDSVYLNSYIPSGENLGVKINVRTRRLEIITPHTLTTDAKTAISKSPKWLRAMLENTLSQLETVNQNKMAQVINEAEDPYIDEVAYSIAYSTPQFLSSSYCFPQLFIENAKIIYQHDSDLNYVDIINYGSSTTDENYYSTVKYWKRDSIRGKVQIEVPKEIYYMDLVHPKTSDEFQTYINPKLVESSPDNSNHTLNIAAPPAGVFWREYLYSHTEDKPDTTGVLLPILKDSVSQCDVIWDDKDNDRQAVREINKWVKSVMNFTSKTERPHQPVRIYSLHIGRCGEHEDLTNAAARACLIPCRGIEAYSHDHVWNEFWDEKWWQWEPTNISYRNPLVYSKGWGWKFGTVGARYSNGVYLPVTTTYSEHTCQITLYALDNNNKPIDGARVMLFAKGTNDQTNIYMDSYGFTDNEGKFIFNSTSGINYFARMDSPLGNSPANTNQVFNLMDIAVEGQNYAFQLKSPNLMKPIDCSEVQLNDTIQDYMLKADFTVEKQGINWPLTFDDFGGNAVYEKDNGKINFLIVDNDNYSKLNQKVKVDCYNPKVNVSSGQQEFRISSDKEYFVLLNNSNNLLNSSLIRASFALYRSPSVGVESDDNLQNDFTVNEIYPNPFSKNT